MNVCNKLSMHCVRLVLKTWYSIFSQGINLFTTWYAQGRNNFMLTRRHQVVRTTRNKVTRGYTLQFLNKSGTRLVKTAACGLIQWLIANVQWPSDIQLVWLPCVILCTRQLNLSLLTDGVTVFCDLREDPDIFAGKGDYQFEVYRLMRKRNK